MIKFNIYNNRNVWVCWMDLLLGLLCIDMYYELE